MIADLSVVSTFLVMTPWVTTDPNFMAGANPLLAVAGTTAITFGIGCAPRWSFGALIVVLSAWGAGILMLNGAGPPWRLFSYDFVAVEWVQAAVCRRLVMRAAIATDTILVADGEDSVARSVEVARHRLARRHCAVMHDTAASTLLMVGQGAPMSRQVLTNQVRRDLETIATFSAMTFPRTRVDILDDVRQLAARCSTPVTVEAVKELWLDSELATAVVGAITEALTNIERHAQATHVTISITEASVTIVDDGRGFDPASDRVAHRFGIRNSIHARLADAGGDASIASRPGAGTRITLHWEAPTTSSAGPEIRGGFALTQTLLRRLAYLVVFVATVVVVLIPQRAVFAETADRSEHLATLAVALACIVIAGVHIFKRVPDAVIWAAFIVVVTLVPLQVMSLPEEDLTTGAFWTFGSLGWAVVALLFYSPIRHSLAGLATYWTVGAAAVLLVSPGRETALMVGYNTASLIVIQAVALIFAVFLAGAVATASRANNLRVQRSAAEAEERALSEDLAERYRTLSRTLVPLLERLRDPTVDATRSDVRLAALIEGARLRRLFLQTDNRDHDIVRNLQPEIARAEQRGVTVSLDVGTPLPATHDDVTDQIVSAVSIALAGANSQARIVFSASPEFLTASVVGDLTSKCQIDIEHLLGIVPAVAGELCWLEIDVPLSE